MLRYKYLLLQKLYLAYNLAAGEFSTYFRMCTCYHIYVFCFIKICWYRYMTYLPIFVGVASNSQCHCSKAQLFLHQCFLLHNEIHSIDVPKHDISLCSLIARFMGPTWGPSGADRTQVSPMLSPWTFLSGLYLHLYMILPVSGLFMTTHCPLFTINQLWRPPGNEINIWHERLGVISSSIQIAGNSKPILSRMLHFYRNQEIAVLY